MFAHRLFAAGAIGLCLAFAQPAFAQAGPDEIAAVKAAANALQDALKAGDRASVRKLLAADAIVLESGHEETVDEYFRHHLGADIEFAKAVPSRLVSMEARVSGQTAWVWSTRVAEGQFRNQAVKLANTELMVLTRKAEGWEVQAIHWSSRKSK
jgi:ketosteroid isomerase-like protein